MAQFVGKWKTDCSSFTNYEEYCKKAGFPEEMTQKFKDDEGTGEFNRDGDNWNCVWKSNVFPEKTYKFTPGKEVEDEFEGKKVLFTITLEGDNKMIEIEKSEFNDFKPTKIVREVNGDTMTCVQQLEDGTKMTYQLKRI